jgi:hypothetical protein
MNSRMNSRRHQMVLLTAQLFPAGADAVCPVFRDRVLGSRRLRGCLGDVSAASLPREVAWLCKILQGDGSDGFQVLANGMMHDVRFAPQDVEKKTLEE